ncbi:hypothetical protein PNOK_0647300 [Pyrrhoderma noxium]|uniref:Uncharacterized protein n=1 Tax=Pyrrhoderma noxium TaxID=2282107 RepID=A0A286UEI1_9AGAM|nr:hypothetical protein PNOK_0647300 [Pyrrhoderma noxium]
MASINNFEVTAHIFRIVKYMLAKASNQIKQIVVGYDLVHGPGLRPPHVIDTGISKSSLSLISDSRAGLSGIKTPGSCSFIPSITQTYHLYFYYLLVKLILSLRARMGCIQSVEKKEPPKFPSNNNTTITDTTSATEKTEPEPKAIPSTAFAPYYLHEASPTEQTDKPPKDNSDTLTKATKAKPTTTSRVKATKPAAPTKSRSKGGGGSGPSYSSSVDYQSYRNHYYAYGGDGGGGGGNSGGYSGGDSGGGGCSGGDSGGDSGGGGGGDSGGC